MPIILQIDGLAELRVRVLPHSGVIYHLADNFNVLARRRLGNHGVHDSYLAVRGLDDGCTAAHIANLLGRRERDGTDKIRDMENSRVP